MKILILNGSPRPNGHTSKLIEFFCKGAQESHHEINVVQVGILNIKGCIACEYCNSNDNNSCAIKDDMQTLYTLINEADMIIFASPVYYWGFSGQLQSTISRFYAIDNPQNAKKYGLILTSASDDVYEAIISQYHNIVDYFNAVDMGIITAYGSERDSQSKFDEAFNFGKRL